MNNYKQKCTDLYKLGCIDRMHPKDSPVPFGWAKLPCHWMPINKNRKLFEIVEKAPYVRILNNSEFCIDDRRLQEFCAQEEMSDEVYQISAAILQDFISIIKII